MKFLIINGPNLNLLGKREPGIYGQNTYESLCKRLKDFAAAHGSTASCFQSNHEGAIIDAIHGADGVYDAIVMNPGDPLLLRHSGRPEGGGCALHRGPHLQRPPAGGVPAQERHCPRLRRPDLRPGAVRLRGGDPLFPGGKRAAIKTARR